MNESRLVSSSLSTLILVNLKYTQSLSLKAQHFCSISNFVRELCQMPQSPFMMILGLSKNPKDSEIVVFQKVMKSVFVLIGMCVQTKEGVKHFGAE